MLTPTNLLLVMCSHRGMHANPGIDEKGIKLVRFLCHEQASGAI